MQRNSPKAAVRGEPSYLWRSGQDRRLGLIERHVPIQGARILDIGCGVGAYVRAFRQRTDAVVGVDIDEERVRQGALSTPNLMLAVGEHLPFRDGAFDVVLLNEVIEHVADDEQTLMEACRVTRPDGTIAIYAPNRLFPFETHGIYLGRRYRFGNIPLVNYLPNPLRNRLVPHARAYTSGGMRRLLRPLPATVIRRTVVYPAFDNISARRPRLGRMLRAFRVVAEHTPLRAFGLSHFIVLRRTEQGSRAHG